MADTIRQQLIDSVDVRFKLIKVANGYNTDLGNSVYHWKAVSYEEADLPLIEYRDLTNESSIGPNPTHDHRLNIEAEIVASAGNTTAAQIRKMIADAKKAIGTDLRWSGLAITTEPINDSMVIEQNEKIIGGAKINFAIIYRTVAWDEYTSL